ncbi:MAG: hypothetical protein ABR503_14125 [Chitinophagaceae bacterium]
MIPADRLFIINRTWSSGDQLTLQLPMEVTTSNWGSNSRAIERGPLVYALKLEEKWEKGTDEKEGEYFNVFTSRPWNYGLIDSTIKYPSTAVKVKVVKAVTQNFIWNITHAPIELKAWARKIPDWKIVNDVAPQPVTARDGLYMGKIEDKLEEITLIPYGCTKVRILPSRW